MTPFDFSFMLSVGATCFEDKFCASKKRWDKGEVGEFQHRVAALAGCSM